VSVRARGRSGRSHGRSRRCSNSRNDLAACNRDQKSRGLSARAYSKGEGGMLFDRSACDGTLVEALRIGQTNERLDAPSSKTASAHQEAAWSSYMLVTAMGPRWLRCLASNDDRLLGNRLAPHVVANSYQDRAVLTPDGIGCLFDRSWRHSTALAKCRSPRSRTGQSRHRASKIRLASITEIERRLDILSGYEGRGDAGRSRRCGADTRASTPAEGVRK